MEHDDCDDLPPPPGHPDEGLGQGCQSQRLLVSPRPIKNPVHDIQQVLLQLNLSGQSCKMRLFESHCAKGHFSLVGSSVDLASFQV